MAISEQDIAAQLIERLLSDPAFRAEFRRDPAAACRDAGLHELADEMALGAGKAMMTLDVRESKSSLAGVMMAAAMEGVGVYQFGEHVLPHIDDVPDVVGDVLSRVNLPALPLPEQGSLTGGAEAKAAAPPAEDGTGETAEAGAAPAGGGAAAAAAPAPPEPVVPPEEAAAGAKVAEDAAGEAVLPPEQAAAAKIAAAESPEAKLAEKAQSAAAEIADEAKDLPSASAFPDSGVAPKPVEEAGPDAGKEAHDHADHDHADHDHGAAAPVTPAPAAPVVPPEVAAAQEAAPAAPVEPAGGGGGGDDAALALLENRNLVLDADAQKDLRDGAVDPRMVALLGKLTEKHKIELSVIKTGHDQFTSGGSVSNHFVGRGIDIARVDGEIVNPGSPASRELATEIAAMTGDLRPTEVGTPWAIGASGFFTDGAHQDHLHVAFDGEPPPGFKAPAAAAPAAPAAAVAAVAPAQPAAAAAAAPAEPKVKASDSMAFKAVTAEEAAKKVPKAGDSMAFQAVQAPPAAAAAAVPAPAVPLDPGAAAGAAVDLSGAPTEYPGNDAPPEQRAAWMAAEAQKRGLPPELPVMASLVESGMKNLNFGHADSVGFFQMRVGIWNQGEYAGYPDKPELQLKWFFDQAEAVKAQRGGGPIDKSEYGEWIADIERPAEQYRYKYGERLGEAQSLLEKAPKGSAAAPVQAAAPVAGAQVEAPAGGGASKPIDPDQFGAEGTGTGGPPSAESLALLKNKNIVLDSVGVSDIKAGRIDPRVVAVLTKLSEDHKITVSCMCSDHSKFTSGGSISNHHFGRGLDIAAIDGEIVNPGSVLAREMAMELQDLDPKYRPNEIGTPWAISGPGYFTDAGHQDHLHVGFKEEIDPSWTPPADVAAGGAAPAGATVPAAPGQAVAAAVPGQPVAAAAAVPAEPKAKPGDSMSFQAVTAEQAAKKAPGAGDSMAFQAVQAPAGPPSAIASPAGVPAPVADAAAATAAGGSKLGASALEIAQGELERGVREQGTNTGVDVDKYLEAAGVPPGNPWCASFITWALGESGHKMEGGGWAAVQTWVRNAEEGNHDLEIVSAEDARPGDLVAYDWGHDEDFGADGHIGFLASNVEGGKFTALEGNYKDAVLKVPRDVNIANVKFIRVNGGEPPAGAGAPVQPAAPVQAAAPVPSGSGSGAAADALAGSAGGGAKAEAAIKEAKKYLGDAYVWGGSTPETGFDCSGLMQWAYAQAGIKIPRVTYDQVDVGTAVEKSELKPGDLVFFGDPSSPHHVGMALGDGKFLHAPKTGDVVKISSLDEPYWKDSFSGARRIDDSAPAAPAATPAAAPVAAAAAAPPPPAVDPAEIAKAQAAVARDAAEVRRQDSMLFQAVKAQEAHKHRVTVQFMKAVDPKDAKGPDPVAAPVAAAAAAGTPGAPSAAEDASMVQAVGAPVPENELSVLNVGPVGTYPGDNASQPELAKWLASEAKKAGLPPELPVMAALVESDVKNLKGGDADSAGFFQMRVSIWDKVAAYRGYRQDPRLQAKWFIDNALAVKKNAIARGDVNFGKDPAKWGQWIADVERPAAQYRYKYQTRLSDARNLLR